MNPPPPRFPASGCVTASAKPTATAASTALPPDFMISTPASEASAWTDATIAFGACVGWIILPASALAHKATAMIPCRMKCFSFIN